MGARALVLIALVALAGCSERERSNPFDPGNPVTRGRPVGFAALAEPSIVRLVWQGAPVSRDVGYRIDRRVEGQADFTPLTAVLPGTTTGYLDLGAANGLRHDYRLYFVLAGRQSGLPAEDHATPGFRRVWFADLQTRSLSRLSADGRHVAFTSSGYFGPSFVAFDGLNRRVWVSDTYDGRVASVDADGTSRAVISGLTEPVSLAVNDRDGDLWVCDQARNEVRHYTLAGNPGTPPVIGGINTPIGVAVDPLDGSIWVCESRDSRLRRFLRNGTANGAVDVTLPSRVAVDSLTRDAWVSSFDGASVVRVTVGGAPADTIPLSGPIGIAVDTRRGRIWVADARAGAVVALRRSGAEEFRVAGMPRVREVAVDLATGECFATVPGLGAVVRLSPAGTILEIAGGLIDPYGVVVEP